MAKCDEGYLCEVCGQDVADLTDSDLYLRYVIGMLDPESLHVSRERHIRCNPALAQFIFDDDFPPVTVEGAFDKRALDPGYVRQKLVLPSHSHGLRSLIEHAAAKRKLKLDVQLEADSFRVLTNLVEEGLGYTLLPPSSVRSEVREKRLEIADIAKQAPMRELVVASPVDHPGSTATAVITSLLRSETAACRDEGLWDIRLA